MIEQFAKLIPEDFLDRSGSVFYSGRKAFTPPKSLYILGLNPGGDPNSMTDDSIRRHTKEILERRPDEWSEYRDGIWNGKHPGTHGMQPRVVHLFECINIDLGTVPASNIAFVRSRREQKFDGDLISVAEQCWPLHNSVIKNLEVKIILCFGRTAAGWVRRKIDATEKVAEFIEQNNRKWKSAIYKNQNDIYVADLTHPSIADWTVPETDPTPIISSIIESVVPNRSNDA
jgi:hypothetical protein